VSKLTRSTEPNPEFLRHAIALASENARSGSGGPFAAVIVGEGRIVSEGVNSVTSTLDPTAHGEVNAIRAACKALGTFTLEGCELYTSCQPCPMCLAACYWSRLDAIYYGASDADAARAAKAIAHSALVKTAWAGSDPNWGRLVAALGYSGAAIDPQRIDIWFGALRICRDGGRAAEFDELAAHDYLKQPEFSIRIDLHQGEGSCVFWTTDLTTAYVHINADYSS